MFTPSDRNRRTGATGSARRSHHKVARPVSVSTTLLKRARRDVTTLIDTRSHRLTQCGVLPPTVVALLDEHREYYRRAGGHDDDDDDDVSNDVDDQYAEADALVHARIDVTSGVPWVVLVVGNTVCVWCPTTPSSSSTATSSSSSASSSSSSSSSSSTSDAAVQLATYEVAECADDADDERRALERVTHQTAAHRTALVFDGDADGDGGDSGAVDSVAHRRGHPRRRPRVIGTVHVSYEGEVNLWLQRRRGNHDEYDDGDDLDDVAMATMLSLSPTDVVTSLALTNGECVCGTEEGALHHLSLIAPASSLSQSSSPSTFALSSYEFGNHHVYRRRGDGGGDGDGTADSMQTDDHKDESESASGGGGGGWGFGVIGLVKRGLGWSDDAAAATTTSDASATASSCSSTTTSSSQTSSASSASKRVCVAASSETASAGAVISIMATPSECVYVLSESALSAYQFIGNDDDDENAVNTAAAAAAAAAVDDNGDVVNDTTSATPDVYPARLWSCPLSSVFDVVFTHVRHATATAADVDMAAASVDGVRALSVCVSPDERCLVLLCCCELTSHSSSLRVQYFVVLFQLPDNVYEPPAAASPSSSTSSSTPTPPTIVALTEFADDVSGCDPERVSVVVGVDHHSHQAGSSSAHAQRRRQQQRRGGGRHGGGRRRGHHHDDDDDAAAAAAGVPDLLVYTVGGTCVSQLRVRAMPSSTSSTSLSYTHVETTCTLRRSTVHALSTMLPTSGHDGSKQQQLQRSLILTSDHGPCALLFKATAAPAPAAAVESDAAAVTAHAASTASGTSGHALVAASPTAVIDTVCGMLTAALQLSDLGHVAAARDKAALVRQYCVTSSASDVSFSPTLLAQCVCEVSRRIIDASTDPSAASSSSSLIANVLAEKQRRHAVFVDLLTTTPDTGAAVGSYDADDADDADMSSPRLIDVVSHACVQRVCEHSELVAVARRLHHFCNGNAGSHESSVSVDDAAAYARTRNSLLHTMMTAAVRARGDVHMLDDGASVTHVFFTHVSQMSDVFRHTTAELARVYTDVADVIADSDLYPAALFVLLSAEVTTTLMSAAVQCRHDTHRHRSVLLRRRRRRGDQNASDVDDEQQRPWTFTTSLQGIIVDQVNAVSHVIAAVDRVHGRHSSSAASSLSSSSSGAADTLLLALYSQVRLLGVHLLVENQQYRDAVRVDVDATVYDTTPLTGGAGVDDASDKAASLTLLRRHGPAAVLGYSALYRDFVRHRAFIVSRLSSLASCLPLPPGAAAAAAVQQQQSQQQQQQQQQQPHNQPRYHLQTTAMTFAEEFDDYEHLVQLCDKLVPSSSSPHVDGDEQQQQRQQQHAPPVVCARLSHYITRFGANFAFTLFRRYVADHRVHQLLNFAPALVSTDEYDGWLALFLEQYPAVAWTHHARQGQYRECGVTLVDVAHSSSSSLADKQTLLSLSKLAALAGGDVPVNPFVTAVNAELFVVQCQSYVHAFEREQQQRLHDVTSEEGASTVVLPPAVLLSRLLALAASASTSSSPEASSLLSSPSLTSPLAAVCVAANIDAHTLRRHAPLLYALHLLFTPSVSSSFTFKDLTRLWTVALRVDVDKWTHILLQRSSHIDDNWLRDRVRGHTTLASLLAHFQTSPVFRGGDKSSLVLDDEVDDDSHDDAGARNAAAVRRAFTAACRVFANEMDASSSSQLCAALADAYSYCLQDA